MSDFRLILINRQSIVHEFEKKRSDNQIVFQNNDFLICFYYFAYSCNDAFGKAPVLISFRDVNFFEAFYPVDIFAHFVNGTTAAFIFCFIGKDEQFTLACKAVCQQ